MCNPTRTIATWCFAFVLPWAAAGAQQIADPDFKAVVEHPAYVEDGLTVAIDEAHGNFHTAEGNYKPLAELLRNDGYRVVANKSKFESASLEGIDVLVVANANAGNLVDAAFTNAEADVVRDWVGTGGSLLLIADHAPYGASAASLGERFGVSMGRGWVFDVSGDDITTQLTFAEDDGSLGMHAIMRGRDTAEAVRRVRSFTGQSLGLPEGAIPLLRFRDTAREAATTNDLDAEAEAYRGGAPQSSRGASSVSVAGRVQGFAMRFAEGKIVVFGEAAMFSAQVATFTGENGPVTIRAGMNVPGNDNRQLALNVFHWLSGLLGDRSGG